MDEEQNPQIGLEKTVNLIDVHNDWLGKIITCLSEGEQLEFETHCERFLTVAENPQTTEETTNE